MFLICILFYLLVQCIHCNLFVNPGFEDLNLISVWTANGAQIDRWNQTAHVGHYSLICYNRTSSFEGPTQDVSLKQATRYKFHAFVKQLGQNVTNQEKYHADVRYVIDLGGASRISYSSVAKQTVYPSWTGWVQLEGSFITPSQKFIKATVSLTGGDPDVDFLVDDFYIEEIPQDLNWRAHAKTRTDRNRKSTVHFQCTLSNNSNPSDYTVKIDLKRHQFGFGAVLPLASLDSPEHQQLVFDNFNWATVHLDHAHGTSTLNSALLKLLEKLQKHNIKVRGKSLLSTTKDLAIYGMNETSLNETVSEAVFFFTLNKTDVFSQLEALTNQHFTKGGYLQTTQTVYRKLHNALPNLTLLLTDDLALSEGYYTHEFMDLVSRLKDDGLDGIGVALQLSTEPDPSLLLSRLDELSRASLPIWITEIRTFPTNDVARADWLETALRVFFSHPAVHGVTFDVFPYDKHYPNSVLFGGNNLQLTASGERVLNLINTEWSTHEQLNLISGTSLTFQGYHGDYDVTVFRNSKPIMQATFTLGTADSVYLLHIDTDRAEIVLPSTKAPLVLQTPRQSTTSSTPVTGRQSYIGSAKSTAAHVELRCVSRWSAISGTTKGATDRSEVSCNDGEVLTGCSSVKKDPTNGDWDHKGEIIGRTGRSIVCRALNGLNTTSGVFAVARCCNSKDLSCTYRSSGPSPPTRGAVQETVCPKNLWAVGCLGSQHRSDLLGVYPSSTGRECLTQNGATVLGSMSAAACCSTKNMLCTQVTSLPGRVTQGTQVSVTCDTNKGYTMTSCSARSDIGKIAGTYVIGSKKGDLCVAFNGADRQTGIRAVATCCWVGPNTGPLIG